MPLAWTLAKFLIKVVAPSVPEIVSTVSALKKQRLQAQGEAQQAEDALEKRLLELERTAATQLQLVEQLTTQLQGLHQTVTIALRLAIGALILALAALAVAILY